MDLETELSNPAFDLPVPHDGLARVHRQAAMMRMRRRAAVALPILAVVAIAVPLLASSERSETLYGGNGPSPPPSPSRAPASQQLQTFCLLPEGGALAGSTDLIGPTGNPIDNCARFWRYARHTDPPALVAYQDSYGNVNVQPKAQPLPANALVLAPGTVQDAEAIELAEALGDPIGLGPDHCRDEQTALADARQVVQALGFSRWPVHVHQGATPAAQQCWGMAPDLKRHVVSVMAVGTGFDYPPVLEQIANPLRASLTQCWTRAKALSEVRAAVAASTLSAEFKSLVDVRQVDNPAARCTVVRLSAGGGIQITLRGHA
jgi:hypothetical protein